MTGQILIGCVGGNYVVHVDCKEELDNDWVELIKEALDLGISADEISAFLHNCPSQKI